MSEPYTGLYIADEQCFSVKVSSCWRNNSATAKVKLREPKVMPKYGKTFGSHSLKIVVALLFSGEIKPSYYKLPDRAVFSAKLLELVNSLVILNVASSS